MRDAKLSYTLRKHMHSPYYSEYKTHSFIFSDLFFFCLLLITFLPVIWSIFSLLQLNTTPSSIIFNSALKNKTIIFEQSKFYPDVKSSTFGNPLVQESKFLLTQFSTQHLIQDFCLDIWISVNIMEVIMSLQSQKSDQAATAKEDVPGCTMEETISWTKREQHGYNSVQNYRQHST